MKSREAYGIQLEHFHVRVTVLYQMTHEMDYKLLFSGNIKWLNKATTLFIPTITFYLFFFLICKFKASLPLNTVIITIKHNGLYRNITAAWQTVVLGRFNRKTSILSFTMDQWKGHERWINWEGIKDGSMAETLQMSQWWRHY